MKLMRPSRAAFIIALSLLLPLSGPAAGEEGRASPKAMAGPAAQLQVGESMTPSRPIVLMADPGVSDLRVPPPAEFALQQKGLMAVQATVSINYLPAGPGSFGDTCITWPANVQAAFTYAANIWASQLQSPVPITIDACWANNLPVGVLGHAGATITSRGFAGAPDPNTWYPVALANALHGSDLDPAHADIYAAFDSTRSNWYFGTDGNTPFNQYDFASVILHEITHGLGFIGSMDVVAGQGSWGLESVLPLTSL